MMLQMSRRRAGQFTLVVLLCMGACAYGVRAYCWLAAIGGSADRLPRNEPLFEGLGNHHREITTDSATSQRFFDQGLAFLYGFNHPEAIRSFEAAARNDPNCAMAFWGIAMANGPHINMMTMSKRQVTAATKAIAKATALSLDGRGSAVEQALIGAVNKRYADPSPDDRGPLDQAYADAMRNVWIAFPQDADVGALFAESLLDLRPWGQWTSDGKPQSGTNEAIKTLETVLRKAPSHPHALHLYIHALEASPYPEKADAAADRLRDLAPGNEHLLHVPSHIDIRRGRWMAAILANEKALAADDVYRQITPEPDENRIWMIHDYHMLVYASMMHGESGKAARAITKMMSSLSEGSMRDYARFTDIVLAMPYELKLRFGYWEAMLAEAPPSEAFPIAFALWRYARAVAFAARNEVKKARLEQQAFFVAQRKVMEGSELPKHLGTNVLPVAEKMLEGELLYREGKVPSAITALRDAVSREDKLPYKEPPNWMLHVRHALGAVLLRTGRHNEAEAVYREDLARHPNNGWSLWGLAQSLRLQGKQEQASAVAAQFELAWQDADLKLSSSCCCLADVDSSTASCGNNGAISRKASSNASGRASVH
jgi:tetratricopeptide (TPR) repeat protein